MTSELVAECLRLAVLELLPVTGAAVGAAVVAGLLAHRFDLHDATILVLLRAAAVLATLALVADHLQAQILDFTTALWVKIADLG